MLEKNVLSKSSKKGGTIGNIGAYGALFLALIAMAFFGVCNPRGPNHALSGIAASVGSEEITYHDFSRSYRDQTEKMRSQYGEDFNPQALKIAATVMDELLDERMLYLKAQELGLTTSDNEIVKFIQDKKWFYDKDNKFSEEVFQNNLRYAGFTEGAFLEAMRRDLTLQKLHQLFYEITFTPAKAVEMEYRLSESKLNIEFLKVDPNQIQLAFSKEEIDQFIASNPKEPSADKIKTYYDSHQSEFNIPEKLHAQHILVAFKGSKSAAGDAANRSKDDAKKKAMSLLEKAKASGADFTQLAKDNTDEPSGKKTGGDLGFFAADSMVKEFADAAFKLQDNQISEIVETPFGFHIIKSLGKQLKKETSLEEATEGIVKSLLSKEKTPQEAQKRAEEVMAALKKGDNVDELIKRYQLSWKKSGDFSVTAGYIPSVGSSQELSDAVLKLKQPQQVIEAPVKVQGSYVIARLVEKKEADSAQLDEKKRKSLSMYSAYALGNSYYTDFEKSARKEFEDKRAIYRNQEYLALDNAQPGQGGVEEL